MPEYVILTAITAPQYPQRDQGKNYATRTRTPVNPRQVFTIREPEHDKWTPIYDWIEDTTDDGVTRRPILTTRCGPTSARRRTRPASGSSWPPAARPR